MFGQIMAWSDEVIGLGLELCTDIPIAEVHQINQQIKQGKINPRDAKAQLAREVVAIHHSKKADLKAEKEFSRIFRQKEKPSQIPVCRLAVKKYSILDLLVQTKLAPSKSEAKRLIEQGGVKIDNQVIKDWQKEIAVKDGLIIQVGKRRFVRTETN